MISCAIVDLFATSVEVTKEFAWRFKDDEAPAPLVEVLVARLELGGGAC